MNTLEQTEYEALTSKSDRAKWLLKKGITAKIVIDPEKLTLAYEAYAAECALPGLYPTAEEAIVKSTAWLANIIDNE